MNQPDERILSGGIIQFVNRRCRRRFRESSFLVQLRNAPYDGNEEEEDEPKHTLSLSLSLSQQRTLFFIANVVALYVYKNKRLRGGCEFVTMTAVEAGSNQLGAIVSHQYSSLLPFPFPSRS